MKTLKYLFIAALAIFSFNACEDVPEPYEIPSLGGGTGGSQEDVVFDQDFSSSLGSFKQNVSNSELTWGIDYSSACITGHYKDENNQSKYKAGESYLVSPAIDLTGKEAAHIVVNHVICYANTSTIKDCHKILLSTDYNGDATKATWIETDFVPVGSSSFTFAETSFNLPAEVLGKSAVYVALYYKSTDNAASTWEVKSIAVKDGDAAEKEEVEVKEMTVAEAIDAYSGTPTPAVVKGYIVGWVEGQSYESGAKFNGNVTDDTEKTDVLLADSPDETDPAKCIPVQLPSGAVRSKVNLKDNPDNYKKFVTLTGSIEKYFGVPGLKSVTKALFEGESDDNTGEGGDTEEPTGKIYLKETFAESLGAFKTAQIVNDYAWKHEVYNEKAYAKVSGYANGASQDAESWLISPVIDFTGETVAKITFDYVVNKGDASLAAKNHQLMITDNYTGDFYTTEWTAVDFGATNDNTWTFRSASAAIPAQFMGKSTVVIAFKYTSTTSASSTWEVNNVVVSGNAASDGNTGEGDKEETPTGDIYIKESFETSFGEFTTTETVANYPWVIDYSCAKVTAYDSASKENNAAESWLVSPAIDFSKETEAYIIFDYVVRYTESGKVKDYSQLLISNDYTDDVATATWTAIDYNVKENPSDWNFYNTGKIAIPAEFMGKENVRIAFKYTSSATKAGTWEVKNVVVAKGAADTPETPEAPDTPDTPEEGNVLTVEQLIAAYNSGTTGAATITGYIVGTSEAGKSKFTPILGLDKASNTNIIIADNPNETDTSKCIPVQLPSGVVRTGVNLVDNPGNLGKKITLTGEIQKYFGMAGFKNATAYTIE